MKFFKVTSILFALTSTCTAATTLAQLKSRVAHGDAINACAQLRKESPQLVQTFPHLERGCNLINQYGSANHALVKISSAEPLESTSADLESLFVLVDNFAEGAMADALINASSKNPIALSLLLRRFLLLLANKPQIGQQSLINAVAHNQVDSAKLLFMYRSIKIDANLAFRLCDLSIENDSAEILNLALQVQLSREYIVQLYRKAVGKDALNTFNELLQHYHLREDTADMLFVIALASGSTQIAMEMINLGKVRRQSPIVRTALEKALEKEQIGIVMQMLQHGMFQVDHSNDEQLLNGVAKYGDAEMLDYLVRQGARLRIFGKTLINFAVVRGNVPMVKYMLERGYLEPTVEEMKFFVYTSLRKGYTELYNYLISRENGQNSQQQTIQNSNRKKTVRFSVPDMLTAETNAESHRLETPNHVSQGKTKKRSAWKRIFQ